MQKSYAINSEILDAKYNDTNLLNGGSNCSHISTTAQQDPPVLLNKHEELFESTLDLWVAEPY